MLGQIVVDKSLQGQNIAWTNRCRDKTSHGQIVAGTKHRMDKSLQRQIVMNRMLQSFMTQYICASSTNFVRNDGKEWTKL
jgi:hypothetical protein